MKVLFLTNDYFDLIHSRRPFVEFLNSNKDIECSLGLVSNIEYSDCLRFDRSFKGLKDLRNFIRRENYSLVISRGVELSIVLLPILIFCKIKKVVYITGLGSLWGKKLTLRTFPFRLIFKFYISVLKTVGCKFWVQNDDDLVELGLAEYGSVLNGSGVKFRENLISKEKNHQILFAGRITYEKGFHKLLELAMELPDGWKLYICGDLDSSISNKDVEKFMNTNRLGKMIYKGFEKDLTSYFEKCSFAYYPTSYREGTPRFILESMNNGLLPLVPYVPGCKNILDKGRGLNVAKNNWVQELLMMDKSYFLECIEHNRNLIRRNYSSEVVFQEKLRLLCTY